MTPLTRPPGAQRPSLRASALRLTIAPAGSQEPPLRARSELLTWVLPNALATSRLPADEAARGSWLAELRQERISVLVGLDGSRGISHAVAARYHMHAVACPLARVHQLTAEEMPVATVLSLCGGLIRLLRQGQRIVLHCDQSLERSALVSSALQLWMGRPLHEATQTARQLQGDSGPSLAQKRFFSAFQAALAQAELCAALPGATRMGLPKEGGVGARPGSGPLL